MKRILFFIISLIVMDKLMAYPHYSPYSYCGGDPVNCVDPTGCEIRGVSKGDAERVVSDIREMFPGDEFSAFRELIVQSGKKHNGKTLATIPQESLSIALNGLSLSNDQRALLEIVVNTINSSDVHTVEYKSSTGVVSRQAEEVLLPKFMDGDMAGDMPIILEANGGLPVWLLITQGGGGLTTSTKKGSYSLIVLGGEHPNGMAVTTGHEIFGHGRSLAVGVGHEHQHIQAIRTENLILRVMGIPFINTGIKHADGTLVPNPVMLPSFR